TPSAPSFSGRCFRISLSPSVLRHRSFPERSTQLRPTIRTGIDSSATSEERRETGREKPVYRRLFLAACDGAAPSDHTYRRSPRSLVGRPVLVVVVVLRRLVRLGPLRSRSRPETARPAVAAAFRSSRREPPSRPERQSANRKRPRRSEYALRKTSW